MKELKILITNDDGIAADGIRRLAMAARKYGQVWVVAPDSERSAMSHAITLRKPIDVYPCEEFGTEDESIHAFKCSGTPADCIRVGSLNVVPGRPDLVLSGINYGYNSASDLQYSATAGAAFEAVFQKIPAIAVSEPAKEKHEVSDAYLEEVLDILIGEMFGQQDYNLIKELINNKEIMNVNFPACDLKECKGIIRDRKVSRRSFFIDSYKEESIDGNGKRYTVNGVGQDNAEEGTDFEAILNGYVSIGRVRNVG